MPSSNFYPTAFRIVIDNPQKYYASGDVVSGHVVLNATQEQPIGQVSINFMGRGKTKIVRNNGQSRVVYRGRAVFFDIPQLLYSGKFTHKADTYTWPFSFTICTQAQPTLLQGDRWDGRDGYLSSDIQVSRDGLPPTFQCEHSFHASNEAFVEYKLTATLSEPGEASRFLHPSTYKTEHHLELAASPTDYPITHLPSSVHARRLLVNTLRLLPEYADPMTKLSFKQKTHSIFKRSSLPELKFKINVTLPQAIQLDHPDPVPVLISVELVSFHIPSDESSSSSSTGCGTDSKITSKDPSVSLPRIKLTRFSLSICARTNYRCQSVFLFSNTASQSHTDNISVVDTRAANCNIPQLAEGSTPDPRSEAYSMPEKVPHTEEPLDLGALHNIRFAQGRTSGQLKNGTPCLPPSFRTCNISHTHSWRAKFEIDCAGEKSTIDLRDVPLEVLGRARYNQQTQTQPQLQPATADGWTSAAPQYMPSDTANGLGNDVTQGDGDYGIPAYGEATLNNGWRNELPQGDGGYVAPPNYNA